MKTDLTSAEGRFRHLWELWLKGIAADPAEARRAGMPEHVRGEFLRPGGLTEEFRTRFWGAGKNEALVAELVRRAAAKGVVN